MAASSPKACCTIGVKHEGVASGQIKKIGQVEAYFAHPEKKSPTAIILLPDVIGHQLINTQLLADQFAANGYLTVVPDLFFGNPVPLNPPAGFDIFQWLRDFPPERVDTVVQSTIEYLKRSEGITTIAAAGYCFGGKYVVRFLGKGVSVGYAAHPSMVDEAEFAGIKGPLSISAAETDAIWPSDQRHKSESILATTGQPWQINLFSGVEHGFTVRGDLSNKQIKFGKEQAFFQAVAWFNEHAPK